MTQSNLIGTFRSTIREHLQKCDSAHTPGVCREIQTPDGYRRIENMIIDLVIVEAISIGSAITAIETELEGA